MKLSHGYCRYFKWNLIGIDNLASLSIYLIYIKTLHIIKINISVRLVLKLERNLLFIK